MTSFAQDLKYALRSLRKSPGFAAVAVITLALGIGANTYIFTIAEAIVFHPLHFKDAGRLVALWERSKAMGYDRGEVSPANFFDWQSHNHVFDHIAALRWWEANLGGIETPEHLHGFLVTPDFFAALDARPALGRSFAAREGSTGNDDVVVLSYGLWHDRFSADPRIVGRAVLVNGIRRTVVGVMPQEFNYPSGSQIWGPLVFTPEQAANRQAHYLRAIAHLAPGVSAARARSEMSLIAGDLARRYPDADRGRDARVLPLAESESGAVRAPLFILLAAVGLVLLIACANVANLLLARGRRRRREVAIRAALGASRRRIMGQMLLETAVLALFGGSAGILFAQVCLKTQWVNIPWQFARQIPGWSEIAIDMPVLGFTLAISFLTSLAFGLVPALRASRVDPVEGLKEAGPGAGYSRRAFRSTLVAAEVALSLTLLSGAGLLMKSFMRLESVAPGFDSGGLLAMVISLPRATYASNTQTLRFFQKLLDRLQSLPGVQDAAAANLLPMMGANQTQTIRIDGRPEPAPGHEPEENFRSVSSTYFQTMRIPVLEGRGITAQDSPSGPPIVAVNAAFARRYWPGQDAVGKRIRSSGPLESNPWRTVVGVVGDVRNEMSRPASPEMYFPMQQQTERTMAIVVRASGDPRQLATSARAQVQAIDPDQPVFDIATMNDMQSISMIGQRIAGKLMGTFALLALLLAAVGLYGVIGYLVSEQTRSIGIRMAIGEPGGRVLRRIVGQGLKLTLAGLAVGLPLALGMGRALGGLLYGVAPWDPTTFAAVAGLSIGVGLLACYLPARRASRIDPMEALRAE